MNITLKSLKFLALDVQATGNSPKSGQLLEIGWLVFRADGLQNQEKLSPQTLFIRPPEGYQLPTHITKLTGIEPSHFSQAVSSTNAKATLDDQVNKIVRNNPIPRCPTVIHFARYEITWLKHIYQWHEKSRHWPFDILCTHQIASRLLPQLPRKGLRAVAGYLGHSVPPLKRCVEHLNATAFIWRKMVERLADQVNIHTLGQLQQWLKETKIPAAKKSYPMPREVRLGLPDSPGIYRMKRSNNDILYIGKAKSLKQRVNSYFQSTRHNSEKTLEMLTQAVKIDATPTPSALEAALLETDAIKQYIPPYNIALAKADRHLSYLSRDFKQNSPVKNEICRLGPVPALGPFVAAYSIGQHHSDDGEALDISETLSMPINHCPDADCFRSGLAVFRERYGGLFESKANSQAILNIGRLSWRNRLKDKTEFISDDKEDDATPIAPSSFVWTPDAVANALESVCRRCGFLLRRARWLTILSESTVAWKIGTKDCDHLNIIQLIRGEISNRHFLEITQPIPLSSNHVRRHDKQHSNMTIETYDRLRVLTTELRRLMTEDRFECIRLGSRAHLNPDQLRVLLDWV